MKTKKRWWELPCSVAAQRIINQLCSYGQESLSEEIMLKPSLEGWVGILLANEWKSVLKAEETVSAKHTYVKCM